MPNPENIEQHKFKPGESGNPNGRPKGARNRSTLVREWLEVKQKEKNPLTGQVEELEQQDLITLALIKKAKKGDVQAYKELMDSAHGKIEQKTDITSKGQKLFQVNILDGDHKD
jgi:hypothetical protein